MIEKEVIDKLKAGGKAREDTYFYLLKHRGVRKAIGKRLGKFSGKLSFYFPASPSAYLEGKSGQIGYVDFFLQEALIRLDQAVRRNALKAENFSNIIGFLATEAYFRCLDFIKEKDAETERRVDSAHLETIATEDPEKTLIDEEKYIVLRSVLDKLGKNCKEILLMFEDDYSMEDIGEKLGYTKDTVKTKKYECKKKLMDFLRKHPETSRFLGNKRVGRI